MKTTNSLDLATFKIDNNVFDIAYKNFIEQFEINFDMISKNFSHSIIFKVYLILQLDVFTENADLSLLSSAYFYEQIQKYVYFDKKTKVEIDKIINSNIRLLKTLIYKEIIIKNQLNSVKVDVLYPEMLFYFPKTIKTIYFNKTHCNTSDEMIDYSSFSLNKDVDISNRIIKKVDFQLKRKFYFPYRHPFILNENNSIYDSVGPIDLEVLILMKQSMLTIDEIEDVLKSASEFNQGFIILKMPNLTQLKLGFPLIDIIATTVNNNCKNDVIYNIIKSAVNNLKLTNVIYIYPDISIHNNFNSTKNNDHDNYGINIETNMYKIEQTDLKGIDYGIIDLDSIVLEEGGLYNQKNDYFIIESLKDIRSKLRIGKVKHLVYNTKGITIDEFSKLLNMGFRNIELDEEDYLAFRETMENYKSRRKTEFGT